MRTGYKTSLDYSQRCPLCGGKDCAKRLGVYWRKRVIIGSSVYADFPVVRYICYRKGSLKPQHRTFSVLPHWLAPYHQHGIDTIIETVKCQHQKGNSYAQTKHEISIHGIGKDFPLENQQILDFKQLLKETFHKLCTIPALKRQLEDCFNSKEPISTVLDFIEQYQTPLTQTYPPHFSNLEKLNLDFFYYYQTTPYFERFFLIGTPSQKR